MARDSASECLTRVSLDERLVTYIGKPTEAWEAITIRQRRRRRWFPSRVPTGSTAIRAICPVGTRTDRRHGRFFGGHRPDSEPFRICYDGENRIISYGMGWQIHEMDGRRIMQHAGYTGTSYLRDLTSGLSVIVLTNRDSNADPHPSKLAMQLTRLADPEFPAIDE